MANGRSEPFKTGLVRFSYIQNAFRPVDKKDNSGKTILDADGNPVKNWQVTLIIPKKSDMTPYLTAIDAAGSAQWGEKYPALKKAKSIRWPILDGEGKEAHSAKTGELNGGMGPDVVFIRCISNDAPLICYRTPAQCKPDEVKSGDYGIASLIAYAWDNPVGGKGVSFGFSILQKKKDGESLGGGVRVDPADFFEPIADDGDEEVGDASKMFG